MGGTWKFDSVSVLVVRVGLGFGFGGSVLRHTVKFYENNFTILLLFYLKKKMRILVF